LTVISTNARSATKKMSQPTGIRILKKYEPMTGRGEKSQSVSRRTRKLIVPGEQKTKGDIVHIHLFLTPYGMDFWCVNPAVVAESQNQSLITKITTNLWKLCGSVSLAISNGIKK
jgi:hypothetical protein